jgi:polar amino acid transport system permease protein
VSPWEIAVDSFFNLSVARTALPTILKASWLTIYLAALIIVTGIACGLALAVLRAFSVRWINLFIILYADFFRTVPPLVLICLFYFGLPGAGVSISGFGSAWLALSLILAAYSEESFWSGISATNRGQWEAGRSTGLTKFQTLLYIILPQAVKIAIAPLTSRTIALAKGTSYASVVAVPEILGAAQSELSVTYNATPLVMAAIAYCIIFIPVIAAGRYIEQKFQWSNR